MAAQETRIITKFLRDRPADSFTIEAALENGAYGALETAFAKEPADVVQIVMDSGLRGRGGAGFGTGQKWSFLPKDIFPRYLAVNGDEGEPSTFKDHMLVEGDPHQLIEGIVIAAYAIQAHHAFVYLRGELALGAERLGKALAEAYARGFVGENILGSGFDLEIILHRGAGCYIAGDETGLLSSLEGERAMPRIKPPFPAVQGMYAAPTIVNNIETLSTVPHILRNGAEWYANFGVNRSKGTRLFSVSGMVERPGNYEVELGMTFRELIYELAGGVRDGRDLGFFIPGGASSALVARAAPRHAARHGLRAGRARRQDDARLGCGDGLRRHRRPAAHRVAHREVLRARVVRQVHTVSRRFRVVGEGALPDGQRPRSPRRPRPPPRVRRQPRARPRLAAGNDHHLPARAEHHVAGGESQPILA